MRVGTGSKNLQAIDAQLSKVWNAHWKGAVHYNEQRAFSRRERTMSSPRRSFALVLDCGAHCSDALVRFVSKHMPGKHLILVDSSELKHALPSLGEHAVQISEIVRIDSDEEIESYDSAFRMATDIEKSFVDVRYKDIPVYTGLKAILIDCLVLVNKINAVFSKLESDTISESIVLAVSGHAYPYLALADLARDHGFRVLPVLACSNWGVWRSPRPIAMRLFGVIRPLKTMLSRASPTRVHERLVLASSERETTTLFHLHTNEYDLYMRPVYPVLAQFQRSGESFFVMSYDSRVQKRLQSMGISVLKLNELPAAAPNREQQKVLKIVGEKFTQLSQAASTGHEPLRFVLPSFAKHALYPRTLEVLRNIEIFREVVSTLRPRSIFIMPDTTSMSAILCKVAEQFGVHTFTTLAASPGTSFRSRGEYSCDYIAVDGTDSLRDLNIAGYGPRLVLVGNSALDEHIRRPKVQDRLVVSRFAPLDFSKHVILIATSRFDPNEHFWMSSMIRIMQERGDSEVVLKIHPLYRATDYQQLVSECSGSRFFLVEEAEVYPLINVADVVVTDYSHIGKEAVILDKPLLTVNLTDRQFPANRYAEDGVAVHASSVEEMVVAIDRLLTDKKLLLDLATSRRRTIDKYNFKNDGQATRRLYELLTRPGDLVTNAEQL